ncbi:MAG: M28 family peptidase [candidate division KSB1 bacterium]|nr:M28 family peptidase [candidate division KSB1 bacterium]
MRSRAGLIGLLLAAGVGFANPEAVAGGRVIGTVIPAEEVRTLQDELSGWRAKDYVWNISRFDRIQASEGWFQAAEYVASRLREVGLEPQLETFPSDGERRYATWTPPMGWRIRRAELWLVEPEKRKLADYRELPTSVAKGSQSADVVADVVAVKRGTQPSDYSGTDVRGKIVLADGYAGDVHREAVLRRGAAGVITYLSRQDRMEFPDFIPYHGLWIRKREQPATTFGFTVSRRTAEQILSWLEQGKKVRVHAVVEGEDYPSRVGTLSCTIPGRSSGQQILFVAHLDHYQPGAVDNASGSAALLELACSLKCLVDSGQLPPPRRSLRFLWTSEWYGTVPWIQAHASEMPQTVAGLNLDMVGGDPVATRSILSVIQTPWSQPSFVNDLCAALLEELAQLDVWSVGGSRQPFGYRLEAYSGGSDHWMFNDATVAVPMPMLFQADFHHHTVQDVPDNIDPTQMERVLLFSALFARVIGWADESTALQLAYLASAGGQSRLAAAASEVACELVGYRRDPQACTKALEAGRNRLHWLGEREKASVRSVIRLDSSRTVVSLTCSLVAEIDAQLALLRKRMEPGVVQNWLAVPAPSRSQPDPPGLATTGGWIPRRLPHFVGPVAPGYLEEVLGPENVADAGLGDAVEFEVANFMDGQRTLRDIWNAVRAEFGDVDYDRLVRYVELLERAGLVELTR